MNIDSYIYGTSFYHKYDTRAKLVFTMLFVILAFFPDDIVSMAVLFLIPLMIQIISLGIRETVRNLLRLLPMFTVLFLFSPFQRRDGEPIWIIGNTVILTSEGIYEVYMIAMRFVIVSLILMCLLRTSRNDQIIKAMRYFHLPYKAALAVSMMLRFIPYLGYLFTEIRNSMSLRLEEGKRGYPLLPSITALAIAAIRMIPETASALEERGYGRVRTKETFGVSLCYLTQLSLSVIIPIILFSVLE